MFPNNRTLPRASPTQSMPTRPQSPPQVPQNPVGTVPVSDSTQCVDFRSFVVILRSGVN